MLDIFHAFVVTCWLFIQNFLFQKKNNLKEYHKSVSQYGSRSSPTVGWAWFQFKLF